MIELIILNYLLDKLDVPVYLEKPSNPSDKFVVIDKTGGSKTNHLLSSSIAFQSYGKTKYDAAMLNEIVKEQVESLIVLNEISGVKLNSDYPFTDVDSRQYRYQALFDINHY